MPKKSQYSEYYDYFAPDEIVTLLYFDYDELPF